MLTEQRKQSIKYADLPEWIYLIIRNCASLFTKTTEVWCLKEKQIGINYEIVATFNKTINKISVNLKFYNNNINLNSDEHNYYTTRNI